ncbi:MAG: hypothetical protein DMG89_19970 [Acidobacteria bacterium]|nr:MAG: hypothetical protein DMG89_19970 [Acidobacteriota bacterium]
MGQKYAYREVRIGPLYPAEALITREAVYEFLSDATNGSMAGFALGKVVRSPIGAMATRAQNVERFLNIGDLGIMHYVEPCYPSNYEGGTKDILDFWSTAVPILRLTRVAGALFEQQKASCNLRIEAHLRKITGQSFWSGPNPNLSLPITTVSDSVPALSQVSSCDLPGNALNITVDLMYQLRWPFGEQAPPPMTNVREVVQKLLANV